MINRYNDVIKQNPTPLFVLGQCVWLEGADIATGWHIIKSLDPFICCLEKFCTPKERKKLGLKKGERRY